MFDIFWKMWLFTIIDTRQFRTIVYDIITVTVYNFWIWSILYGFSKFHLERLADLIVLWRAHVGIVSRSDSEASQRYIFRFVGYAQKFHKESKTWQLSISSQPFKIFCQYLRWRRCKRPCVLLVSMDALRH